MPRKSTSGDSPAWLYSLREVCAAGGVSNLAGSEAKVLLAAVALAADDGRLLAKAAWLARATGLTIRSVRRAVAGLEARGLLSPELKRRGRDGLSMWRVLAWSMAAVEPGGDGLAPLGADLSVITVEAEPVEPGKGDPGVPCDPDAHRTKVTRVSPMRRPRRPGRGSKR